MMKRLLIILFCALPLLPAFAQKISIPDRTVTIGMKFVTRVVHLSSIEATTGNAWSYYVTYPQAGNEVRRRVVASCSDLKRWELINEARLLSELSPEYQDTYPDTVNRDEVSFVCEVVKVALSGKKNSSKLIEDMAKKENSKRDASEKEIERIATNVAEKDKLAAAEWERNRPLEQQVVFCVQTVEVSRTRYPSSHFQSCSEACSQSFNQSMCSEIGGQKWKIQTASPKTAPANWQAYLGFGQCSCIGQEYVLNEVRATSRGADGVTEKETELMRREKALADREKAFLEAENKRLKSENEKLKAKK